MCYLDIYHDLTLAAHRAYTRGIQTGSGGNMAVRVPDTDTMIVKSSGGSFADCRDEGKGWLAMHFDGSLLPCEKGKPTREWLLHATLLQALPQYEAVVHFHSPWAIAWANSHDCIPLVTWHSQLKMKHEIPVLDVPAAVVPAEYMPQILNLFEQTPDLCGFILKGHGLVALGGTAVAAEHMAEQIEETAQIAVLEHLLSR